MAAAAKVTTDHGRIRQWVEARGGHPAAVARTARGGGPGVLRIDFPGYSGAGRLRSISWEDFFDTFEDGNLAFLYQERTDRGRPSRFCKLVDRARASAGSRGSAGRGGVRSRARGHGGGSTGDSRARAAGTASTARASARGGGNGRGRTVAKTGIARGPEDTGEPSTPRGQRRGQVAARARGSATSGAKARSARGSADKGTAKRSGKSGPAGGRGGAASRRRQ